MKPNIEHASASVPTVPRPAPTWPSATYDQPAHPRIPYARGRSSRSGPRSLDRAFLNCLDRDSALRNAYLRRRWQRSRSAIS